MGSHCTAGSASVRMGPARWRRRTWPCSRRYRAPPCSTRVTPPDWRELWSSRPTPGASPTSAPPDPASEVFRPGQAKVLRQSEADQVLVLVIAAGVTLHEALKAAETLSQAGVNIRVMDPFKPLDWTAVHYNSAQCHGRVLTVEDHVRWQQTPLI